MLDIAPPRFLQIVQPAAQRLGTDDPNAAKVLVNQYILRGHNPDLSGHMAPGCHSRWHKRDHRIKSIGAKRQLMNACQSGGNMIA